MTELHPDVANQIAEIALAPDRPLVLCDADEVIFDFMTAFEASLARDGLYYTWSEFKLNGNIRRIDDDRPVANVRALVEDFFAASTRDLGVIEGAREGLVAIAKLAQVVVLTNLPIANRGDRRVALSRIGLNFPVVANLGSKGPPVRALAARVAGPVYFIDDSPSHHADVAEQANHVRRLHFVGHARLAGLIGQAPASHYRAATWPELAARIVAELSQA
ncbi:MAG: hypothetical protein EXQ94_11160 [Alphaproteobacteria bacterium]|nr:hypothetical protein [Alphaproteobacteria bacterium]